VADTVRASFLIGYAELARTMGLDPLRMLDAAGIPRAALTEPDMRIRVLAVRDLLEASGRAADDFGVRMSQLRTPSVMGPVALIAREQPTVRGVLATLDRHQSLHSDITRLPMEDVDDEITIIRLVLAWASPGADQQVVGVALGQLMLILRLYLGVKWRPLGVSLVRAPPKDLGVHHRVFGPHVSFNQDFNGVVCRREDLDRPNPAADPEMARQIERYIEKLGGRPSASLPSQVRERVLSLLPTGRCGGELVARQLGVDRRTLQRQLAAEGANFADIVQSARMGLIPQYLEQSDRPLAEVADLLGFSALSAFSRWHKAHYGQSASARREAARGP
jgi:AraC-like DNA-binding protein